MSNRAVTTSGLYRALARKCRLSASLDLNTVFNPDAATALAGALDHLAEIGGDIETPMRTALTVLLSSPVPPKAIVYDARNYPL